MPEFGYEVCAWSCVRGCAIVKHRLKYLRVATVAQVFSQFRSSVGFNGTDKADSEFKCALFKLMSCHSPSIPAPRSAIRNHKNPFARNFCIALRSY